MLEVRRDDHPDPFVLIIWEQRVISLNLSLNSQGR